MHFIHLFFFQSNGREIRHVILTSFKSNACETWCVIDVYKRQHKSHQQWRISYRCQTSSDIGYQKNKEHNDLRLSGTPFICTDQRTNPNHAGTRRTNPAG